MKTIKVSVVVLTYKKFDNLQNNINSVLKQDYTNYEVIIHDDGSDNFDFYQIEQMLPIECRDKFTIKTSTRNQGTVKNFNKAIGLATGDIIVPLSQDDIFANSHVLKDIVDTFLREDCAVCFGKRQGSISRVVLPAPRDFNLLESGKQLLYRRIYFGNFLSGAALYYKKSTLNDLKLFDERYKLLEDYPAVIKIMKSNMKISGLNEITVVYGERGVSEGSNVKSKVHKMLIQDDILNYKINIKPNLNPKLLMDKYISFEELFLEADESKLKKILIRIKHPYLACLKYRLKKNRVNSKSGELGYSEDFYHLLEIEKRRNKHASN